MKYNLIILVFLLSACKKHTLQYNISCNNPTNNIDISYQLIRGNWTWVSEYYVQPFTGNIFYRTPISEGYTKQILASNSTFEYLKNGRFEQRYHYEFVIEKTLTNYPDDTTNVLVFKNFETGQSTNYVHYKICNDTLTLNYQIRSDAVGKEKWVKIK